MTIIQAEFHIRLGDGMRVSTVTGTPETLLGYSEAQFTAGTVRLEKLIHTDDQDIAERMFSHATSTGMQQVNFRLRQANGRIKCIKGLYKKNTDIDGTIQLKLLVQDAKSLPRTMDDAAATINFIAMMEATDDYIYFKDRNHVFTGASQTLVSLCDATEHWSDFLGKTDYDVFPEEYADIYYRLEKQVFSGVDVAHEVQAILTKTGETGWVDNRKYPIRDAMGEVIGLYGIARNITQQKKIEENLKLTQFVSDQAADAIYWIDEQANIRYVNESTCKMLGYTKQELICMAIPDLDPDYTTKVWPLHWQELKQAGSLFFETRQRRKDGIIIPLEVSANYVAFEGQEYNVAYLRDISERKASEEDLRIAAVTFQSQEAILITDADANIIRVNPAFEEISGYSADELIGQNPRMLQSGRHDAGFYQAMWASLQETGHWAGEIWDRRKSGAIFPKFMTITAVKNERGTLTNYVAVSTDISLRKQSEDEIRQLAFFDPLTSLPNRRLFQDRLQHTLQSGQRDNHHAALLMLDLDHFKSINDTLGHDIGDQLLIEVANRLRAGVREGDTVARLGGDEFIVILERLDEQMIAAATQAEHAAEHIREALTQPYHLNGHELHSSPSIGITLFKGLADNESNLLKHADVALYAAKAAGRNAIRFFDPRMQAALDEHTHLEGYLHKALERQEFRLFFQSQVDTLGNILGAEVLIRWQHAERGLVYPDQFISVAEECGLIVPIGLWVMETACKQLVAWADNPLTRKLTLAINVSALQFGQPDFVSQVQRILQVTGVNPERLKLELTESMLLNNVEDCISKMLALQKQGVTFSLDDFGTGHSSLSYLKRLPLSQIKIDRSFVRDIATDSNDAAIVNTIIAMGRTLGLGVVAEGVETDAQRDFLEHHGCQIFQGYLFSQPITLEQFESALTL